MRLWKFALAAALALASFPALAQSGQRQVPLGFCSLSSVSSATKITTSNCVFASVTASISGTVLTVTAVGSGGISVGQTVLGTGVASSTIVTGIITGTGGVGRYNVNNSQTVGSETITTAGVPQDTTLAIMCSSTQAVNWRDDGVAPTATPGSGGIPIASGTCTSYNGTFTALQFIQQTSTAVLGIAFYR